MKMNKNNLLIFAITSLFFTAALMVTVLVVNNYQSTLSTNQDIINNQLVLSFINENTKRYDSIAILSTAESSVLTLNDNEGYTSYLYTENGYLYEAYLKAATPFDSDYGNQVIASHPIDFAIENDLLIVTDRMTSNFILIDLGGKV